jgi:hypothetical protein
MSAIACTGSPVTGCVLHHFPEQLSVTELASALALKSNGVAANKKTRVGESPRLTFACAQGLYPRP